MKGISETGKLIKKKRRKLTMNGGSQRGPPEGRARNVNSITPIPAQWREDNGSFHCLFEGCTEVITPSGFKQWRMGPMYEHHQEKHLRGLELEFKCTYPGCTLSFYMQGLLGAHMRNFHKSYGEEVCDVCGKTVAT